MNKEKKILKESIEEIKETAKKEFGEFINIIGLKNTKRRIN